MEFVSKATRISALALGIAGALACGQAQASAFQLKENSVKAQGRAMAGSASAKGDASVVANNPAVMSTFTEKTVQADVTAIDLSFKFNGGGSAAAGSPLAQPLTGGNGGDAGGLTAVPAASFVLPLSDGFEYLTLGAMISAPFGLKTEYDNDWVGRYHALKSDVRIIDLTLAASLELSDTFSTWARWSARPAPLCAPAPLTARSRTTAPCRSTVPTTASAGSSASIGVPPTSCRWVIRTVPRSIMKSVATPTSPCRPTSPRSSWRAAVSSTPVPAPS
jgi:hypothetical protein